MTMDHANADARPFLVSIGDVRATQKWVVTPAGNWPANSVKVTTQDQTATLVHTPAWAIVMVVVFIWVFFLSLFFLLARETRVSGYVNVTIWGPAGQSYTENVEIWSSEHRSDVFQRVTYLQGLIGHQRTRNAQ